MERHMILGTDFWTDCDDVAAIRLACRFAKQKVWTLEGIVLNACMAYSAPALGGFLAHEGVSCPVGIDREAADFGGNPPYQKNMAALCPSPLTNDACEEGTALYRRILSRVPDGTAEILEIGYPQVLAALLTSEGDEFSPLSGIALVRKKVRRFWVMGGNWKNDGHGKENNFSRNARAAHGAHTFLSLCPADITFLGWEVGASVLVRPKTDEADPVYRAFRDHHSEAGRSAWDPMLVLLAAAGEPAEAGYNTVEGLASVDAETGENFFAVSADRTGRNDRYVVKQKEDDWYEERLAEALR